MKSSDLHSYSYLDCMNWNDWENLRISVFVVNTLYVDSDVDLQIEKGETVL